MNNDNDAPVPKARMVVSSKPCPLGLALDTADFTLPSTPPGRTLTKISEAPPGLQKITLNSPPTVGTPPSCKSPTREAPAVRAAKLPAPRRKANVQSRRTLSEMSPLAGGADGPGVCGKFIGWLAWSNNSRRSCRPARNFFGGLGLVVRQRIKSPCTTRSAPFQSNLNASSKQANSLFSESELVPWCLDARSSCHLWWR
jgi:hypothetical protein